MTELGTFDFYNLDGELGENRWWKLASLIQNLTSGEFLDVLT